MPCLLEGKGEDQYSTKYCLISPALGPHARQVRTIMVSESWVDRLKRERGRDAHGVGERGGFEKARIVRDRQTWMACLHIDSKVTSMPLWLKRGQDLVWAPEAGEVACVDVCGSVATDVHSETCTLCHRGSCQSEWPLLLCCYLGPWWYPG